MNILEVPFNLHLGFTFAEHDGKDVVCLVPQPSHLNHLGTIHAGALYSLAEAACGHELMNRIGSISDEVFAVVRAAKVKYRKPANGRVIGVVDLDHDTVTAFVEKLQAKGRAMIEVPVRVISDESVEVFTGEFSWFASLEAKS